MAMWPAAIPQTESSRREVATLALPMGNRFNPAKKGQEDEDVVGESNPLDLASCMTMRVTNTPLMMQDSCMFHSNLDRLSLSLLRWKQKMKKN